MAYKGWMGKWEGPESFYKPYQEIPPEVQARIDEAFSKLRIEVADENGNVTVYGFVDKEDKDNQSKAS